MPTTNFDPVAMGLYKQWTGRNMDRTDAHDTPEEGTQIGWSKSLGDGRTQQYDMEGNDLGITEDKSTWDSVKPLAAMAAMAFGANALLGPGAGAVGTAAGTGEALMPSLASLAEGTVAPTVAGSTAGTSTLGTLTGAGYAAPALEAGFTSGLTAGGATAGLGAAGTTVAGYGGVTGLLTGAGLTAGSTLSEISTWIKANKELASMAFAGVAGAIKSQADVDAAAKLAQSRLDQLNLVQQQKLEDNARTSASVSGLRKPGLISQAPLARIGGTPVFGSAGLINRG